MLPLIPESYWKFSFLKFPEGPSPPYRRSSLPTASEIRLLKVGTAANRSTHPPTLSMRDVRSVGEHPVACKFVVRSRKPASFTQGSFSAPTPRGFLLALGCSRSVVSGQLSLPSSRHSASRTGTRRSQGSKRATLSVFLRLWEVLCNFLDLVCTKSSLTVPCSLFPRHP
jgi:hypothetical protein